MSEAINDLRQEKLAIANCIAGLVCLLVGFGSLLSQKPSYMVFMGLLAAATVFIVASVTVTMSRRFSVGLVVSLVAISVAGTTLAQWVHPYAIGIFR